MHQPKVTKSGCYSRASTTEGHYCFDHVECKGDLQCYTFLVPKYIKMASGGIKKRPKDAPGYSRELCAPEGSTTVLTSVIYPDQWVKYPKREFIPKHTMKVRVYKDTGDSPIIDDSVEDSQDIAVETAPYGRTDLPIIKPTVGQYDGDTKGASDDSTATDASTTEYSETDALSLVTSAPSRDSAPDEVTAVEDNEDNADNADNHVNAPFR